jgi:hypothetical protein
MAKRTTPSLAFSEYVSPDANNSFQVWQGRLRLIEAAKRVYPIFLKKLSSDVFPLYCQLAKEGKLAKGRNDFDKALWGKSPYDALTDDGGLKSALSEWAACFNAEADWLMVGALRTLRGWYVAPEWRESLAWDPLCVANCVSAFATFFSRCRRPDSGCPQVFDSKWHRFNTDLNEREQMLTFRRI